MPEITRFYGIVIKMFFKPAEHEPPHIHAVYGDCLGAFDVKSGSMTAGDLPKKARGLITEWIGEHKDELMAMWENQRIEKLPPLE